MTKILEQNASRKPFYHLKKDEKEICKRFIRLADIAGDYWYDVHLESKGLKIPSHWTKHDIDRWMNLLAKRVDLLVVQEGQHWIFEITPKLSKASIGGCLTYKDLYIDQFKPGLPVRMGIVVEMDDPTYHSLLESFGIKLFVV